MNYDEINEFLKKYSDAIFSENNTNDNNNNKNSQKEDSKSNYKNNFNYGFFYTNENGYGCNDMPGGFQKINPMLFVVIGDILGDLMSGKLPFNVQNAVGNWIQLVGQAIETYSGQQQYFQSGPGRYYSPENLNVTNPLCPTSSSNETTSTSNTNSNSQNETSSDNEKLIESLYCIIKDMKDELDDVKSRVKTIERQER